MLAYRGLVAFDARGRVLRSWLELSGGRLEIQVRAAGAAFPVRIDPLLQAAKLTASDAPAFDHLGWSVAVSADGSTVIAGDPAATDNGTGQQGAAYVFVKPSGGWATATETAKLTASDGADGDQLGYSVAVSADGSTVIAGAPTATVNGNGNQGAAYVFVKPSGGWATGTETAKLTASDGRSGDYLGYGSSAVAVSADGSTVIAGTQYMAAAYVFVKPSGGWATGTQTAKLTGSDYPYDGGLGTSVAISADGSTVIVGAAGANGAGAAYVFVEPSTGWASETETAKLTASDGTTQAGLGYSVAVSADGSTVIVGAYDANVNGNEVGAAYVFVEPSGGWGTKTQTARLTASDGAAGDGLGSSVAVSADGSTVIAGAPFASVNGNASQGAAYVFVEPSGGWATATETAKLTASDGVGGDDFGYHVAVSADGSTVIAGAPSPHAGVGSPQGAAYVFGTAPCATAPAITSQPSDQTVTAPAAGTFSAAGSTPPNCRAPSVQWYSEPPGANGFSPIAAATSTSYTTPATTVAQSGTRFEAVFTNAFGSTATNVATLTVNPPPCGAAPGIVTQPSDQSVTAPAAGTFSAAGSTPANCGAPSVQWYSEPPGANGFSAIAAATSTSYTTPATTVAQSGTRFEAVFTNAFGSTATNVATLTVTAPVCGAAPAITTQPSDQSVTAAAAASFSAAGSTPANCGAPSVQWYSEPPGANGFSPIAAATSTSYTTPATTVAQSGTRFEAVFTNTFGSSTTNPATLTVNRTPRGP